MKSDPKFRKILFIMGVFFIGLGLVLNEFFLTALFSEDGVVLLSLRLKIWLFDGFCIYLSYDDSPQFDSSGPQCRQSAIQLTI